MKKLSSSLQNKASRYLDLPDKQKLTLINTLYLSHEMSWRAIADVCNTYPNKILRDAKRLGIESRDKSEAQSVAISSGRHDHPTKGKGHSEETKIKISEAIAKDWDLMDEKERKEIRAEAKRRWDKKTDQEIEEFRRAAYVAIKATAKEGSALEKYLLHGLVDNGYQVEFHREHYVVRERLQIDLFIPKLNVAIEVDGPSHFSAIWGEEVLAKNQQRDSEKNGLLLQRGCVIIRVRQTKPLSEKFKRDTLAEVLKTLDQVKKKKPQKGKRCIIIGD